MKYFDDWNKLKKDINENSNAPTFREREIWWCSIGVNVGHESDGKNAVFHRPILIVRKFNNQIFYGIPLTTKIKENKFYHKLHFKEREQCAMLTQLRIFDAKRLHDKMGVISAQQFENLRNAIKELF